MQTRHIIAAIMSAAAAHAAALGQVDPRVAVACRAPTWPQCCKNIQLAPLVASGCVDPPANTPNTVDGLWDACQPNDSQVGPPYPACCVQVANGVGFACNVV